MGEISAKWRSLSESEKASHTEEALAVLRDTREMRELASHNVPINAFHDVRATLDTLDEEVSWHTFLFKCLLILAIFRLSVFTRELE